MTTQAEKHIGKPCRHKGCDGKFTHTRSHNEWWVKCDECDMFLFVYEPMPHQFRFHQDSARFKMFGGGFGSAKTVTVAAEFVTLALKTPNGVGLVGATTYPQLERTSKKQVMDMIPEEFVENMNKKDNVLTLINGYEVLFRSYDDEQKLRSLNLCHALMEEANGTDFSIFTQLQTRLRHHATKEHKILISTNPDNNWVRSELLMKAYRIYGAREKYDRKPEDINRNISVHISRTDQNIHLPDGYIESLKVGKPDWWVSKFLYGSFNFSEGAVYPNFAKNIVEPDEMTAAEIRENVRKKGWKVYGGADFGIVDPTVLILFALDPVEGVLYAYDEYYQRQFPVPEHAKEMKRRMAHIPYGALQRLLGDPSGAKRNINDRKSIFNHYAEYGISFQPADNRIDAGILKVYAYLEMGRLRVLRSLSNTIEEMRAYRYKPHDMDEAPSEKPADGEDHTVDVIRYVVHSLPDDPNMLKNATYGAEDVRFREDSQSHLPFELQTNEDELYTMSHDSWMNY